MILAGLPVARLSLGEQHSLIWKRDGSVWSTAVTSHGGITLNELGAHFVRVIPNNAVTAAAGKYYNIVLTKDETLWVTGRSDEGRLGEGRGICEGTFSRVGRIPGAVDVVAGGFHSLVLTEGGRVRATGSNAYGQLGDGTRSDNTGFAQSFSGPRNMVVAMAAGDHHSMVIKQDGSAWGAGRNYNGQLGDGFRGDRNQFVRVVHDGAVGVAAGGFHSLILKTDDSVWTTGWNAFGQLGDGTTTDRENYVPVIMSGAKAIAAGSRHSVVVKRDGSVWATGYNAYGQLGDGSRISRLAFVQVMSDGAQAVAAGGFHSMVLKEDDSIWVTGSNENGQFGDGTKISTNVYSKLVPFDKVVAFKSGAG